MANWFDNLQTSSLLTGAAAVGASVVLPGYVPAEWIAAVGGFGTNLLSNFAARFFDRRDTDPRRPDLNHDLLRLVSKAGIEEQTETLLAERLHTQLWEAIHSELKHDFAGEGRAYAALHLGFMGEALATLNELVRLPREQTQLTQELLEELRAHKARQADPKQEAIVAALAPEEQRRLAPLSERLDSLSAQLNAQIGRVLAELATIKATVTKTDVTVT